MLSKIGYLWKRTLPRVKVAGTWREIHTGWVKQNGVFRKFQWPFLTPGVAVVLQQSFGTAANGDPQERRSFIRAGSGSNVGGVPGAPYMGNISQFKFDIDGETFEIRGVETGSDVTAAQIPSWRWISLQFFGRPDINKMCNCVLMNGYLATLKTVRYNADLDITFLSFEMDQPRQFPVNTNLSIRF